MARVAGGVSKLAAISLSLRQTFRCTASYFVRGSIFFIVFIIFFHIC